jgi:3-oxoacyl-[acyl-carrier-protein] synthase-1
MGAAGVLETIISQKSIEENLLLSTAGFGERGVSRDINIVKGNSVTQKSSFIKMLSGFGGCNVALLFKMGE